MSDAAQLAGLVMIPAATATVAALLIRFCCPNSAARYLWGAAVGLGFLAGYLIFPDDIPRIPNRHWHWLPYVGVVAALLGGACGNSAVAKWERLLLYALLGGLAAWQLVPNYADLKPTRLLLVPLLGGYFTAIAFLLSLLPERLRGRPLVGLLTLASVLTSVMVISEISLKIGLFAARVPIALGCCTVLSWLLRPAAKLDFESAVLGLLPIYAILVGGTAFVGAIELPSPKWLLLLGPATPLLLWQFAYGPLARLQGKTAIAVQMVAIVLIPLALLVWWNWPTEPADEWSYVIESFHDSKM